MGHASRQPAQGSQPFGVTQLLKGLDSALIFDNEGVPAGIEVPAHGVQGFGEFGELVPAFDDQVLGQVTRPDPAGFVDNAKQRPMNPPFKK
jgi:hypothetical protein